MVVPARELISVSLRKSEEKRFGRKTSMRLLNGVIFMGILVLKAAFVSLFAEVICFKVFITLFTPRHLSIFQSAKT